MEQNGSSVMVARDSKTDGDSITMDRSHTDENIFSGVAGIINGSESAIGIKLNHVVDTIALSETRLQLVPSLNAGIGPPMSSDT